MKILTQDYQNNLVWKDVIYKEGWFRSPDDTCRYDATLIYGVKDDNRNKTVICSACGKEVPNTRSAIKAHRNMVNKANKCFECGYLRTDHEQTVSHKYVLNEDGTYTESTKRNVTLSCRKTWRAYDINSEEAKAHCKYAACENATFNSISDFWTQYPNAFDEFITIDRIMESGYKRMHKTYNNVTFELSGRASLVAYVNSQGICYNFRLHHRNEYYVLRYSKKYDQVFVNYSGRIRELSVLDIADSTKEAITKKLRALYK